MCVPKDSKKWDKMRRNRLVGQNLGYGAKETIASLTVVGRTRR